MMVLAGFVSARVGASGVLPPSSVVPEIEMTQGLSRLGQRVSGIDGRVARRQESVWNAKQSAMS